MLLHVKQPSIYNPIAAVWSNPIKVMIGYPMMSTATHAIKLDATPIPKKSETLSHASPRLSSKLMAFMLGKEETGSAMPPEHIKQVAMTNVFGLGSGNISPICKTTGRIINAPTVCDIKEVTMTTMPDKRATQ